jgi:hypothetical protein
MGTIRIITTRRELIGKRLRRWGVSRRTTGAYTICTGMCANGAGTGMAIIPAERRATPGERPPAATAWYAAGRGTTLRRACVRRFGTPAPRPFGTTMLVSVWCVLSSATAKRRRDGPGAKGVRTTQECQSPNLRFNPAWA